MIKHLVALIVVFVSTMQFPRLGVNLLVRQIRFSWCWNVLASQAYASSSI